MSFFGFEANDLEKDKQNFLDGGWQQSEDVAVYTWGEDSYDGLGDALQEGGDDLNDETFGGTGAVGKDFDFSSQALPDDVPKATPANVHYPAALRDEQAHRKSPSSSLKATQPSRAPQSLESIWDDKSPFSVLPRANGSSRSSEHQRVASSVRSSPYLPQQQAQPISHGINQTGVRTLQEIEAEMRAQAARGRQQQQESPQMLHQQPQQHRNHFQQQESDIQFRQLQQAQLRLLEQQQKLQQQNHMQHQLNHGQQQQLHQRTPPPRMLPQSQSPRFHLHQQQLMLMQQQQNAQQQQRFQEMQEQLRVEEIERQLRNQHLRDGPTQYGHQRQPSGPTIAELQATKALQQPGRNQDHAFPLLNQQNIQQTPHGIQAQQRLLAELAQAEFARDLQNVDPVQQEALRAEAVRKIMETEKMEEKRRRKAAKIAHMARYNDLMTQSDKDFITRIQVSQLVTSDPYADDFYAQVYGAILRSRLGQESSERVLKFGSGGGVGLGSGLPQQNKGRRPNAMQRMEAQVERIVSNAKTREKEKGLHSLHSLQGALGKTSGRSYKAAPRQLLQVDPNEAGASPTLSPAHAHISKEDAVHKTGEGAAQEAAKLGRAALGDAAPTAGVVRKDPLAHRETLAILERMYDLVLEVEQLRRDQPPPEEAEAHQAWETSYNELVEKLWVGIKMNEPLEISDPHPFISLLAPAKGKKILPRVTRHFNQPKMLQLLAFLMATFSQLDVFRMAPLLDSLEDTAERREAERQTQAFLGSVLQSILPEVAKASLQIVTGLLSLLIDRSNIAVVAQTRPGLALLTLCLSRVEVIKQNTVNATEVSDMPSAEEAQKWQSMLDHLYQLLTPHFTYLFPSTRLAPVLPPLGHPNRPTDIIDQPVWQFLAALALHASPEQQQILVTALREKVLENVTSVNKGWVADEEQRRTKLANVNLFLHALGLDSSQIAM